MTQNSINNEASELTVDNLFLDGNEISSTDTNGNIILAPDGSGDVSIAANLIPSTDRADALGSATNSWDNLYTDGISFNDGTDTLANYIAPTSHSFTIEGATSAGVGTYTTQVGSYMRIGDIVYASWNLAWSAHTGTGQMRVGNLPVAPADADTGTVQFNNASTLPATPLWGVVSSTSASSNLFLFFTQTSGAKTQATISSTGGLRGSIAYYV